MQYLISPHGQYVGTLSGTVTEIIDQVPPGHSTTVLPPPRPTDYWNGTEWVAIGVAPSPNHKYDYETKQWKDFRTLEEAKQQKWDAIKLQRNKLEFGGFIYLGKKFDSDQISQVRIIAAVMLAQPITWTLADDSAIDLDKDQLIGLGNSLANHVNSTHARGRLARQLIELAQTHEEVEAVLL